MFANLNEGFNFLITHFYATFIYLFIYYYVIMSKIRINRIIQTGFLYQIGLIRLEFDNLSMLKN